MLFHLGALRRLNEFGLLDVTARISSVSGGSITAAALAAESTRDDDDASSTQPLDAVAVRLHDLASRTIDTPSVIAGVILKGSAATHLAAHYRRVLGDLSLQDLPDRPRFTFNTTNFVTGALVRWSKEYAADYRAGTIFAPDVPLAHVIAASSAFPPFLSPMTVKTPGELVDHGTREIRPDQPKHLVLTDGGVYDNHGLETLKSFHTILVSDGGSPFDHRAKAPVNWFSQSLRTTAIINSQVRAIRTKEFVGALDRGERLGALWTIATPMDRYRASNCLPVNPATAAKLAQIPTRLKSLPKSVQHQLVNLGYTQADAAVRSYVESELPPPLDWPYPSHALG